LGLFAAEPAGTKPPPAFASVETKDLHNAHRISDRLVSGAAPETEQAFKDLQALGVKTILTVDGAQPDVETAKRYGMRYVHLPIGYDGVEREEGKRIAKALTELPGPIYVHCHHGKHRSAAAVAVACVMNGQLRPEQAESVLKTFGTGENYLGLWKAARDARPLDAKELAETKVEYVERAKIPELAERMVAIDGHMDHLKSIENAGWTSPPDHPDLDPAHEALQLEEHLRETARTDDTKARPQAYRTQLTDAEAAAAKLREVLGGKPVDLKTAGAAFKTLGTSCASCHKSFRD
jgi:protein tyrosine phosphatase (PTP) superfamily phosphohydrolase (DUF442 family)